MWRNSQGHRTCVARRRDMPGIVVEFDRESLWISSQTSMISIHRYTASTFDHQNHRTLWLCQPRLRKLLSNSLTSPPCRERRPPKGWCCRCRRRLWPQTEGRPQRWFQPWSKTPWGDTGRGSCEWQFFVKGKTLSVLPLTWRKKKTVVYFFLYCLLFAGKTTVAQPWRNPCFNETWYCFQVVKTFCLLLSGTTHQVKSQAPTKPVYSEDMSSLLMTTSANIFR